VKSFRIGLSNRSAKSIDSRVATTHLSAEDPASSYLILMIPSYPLGRRPSSFTQRVNGFRFVGGIHGFPSQLVQGEWIGEGARMLGLEGAVAAQVFESLAHPASGRWRRLFRVRDQRFSRAA